MGRKKFVMNIKASFVSVVHALSNLSDEELAALADNPDLIKEFAGKLVANNAANTYVVALSDSLAVGPEAKACVAKWRKYASDLGYTGPVVWKVKAGYTLKEHASQDKNAYNKLSHVQNRQLEHDEPTKDSLVFWVPRLAEGSNGKDIYQMKQLREELRLRYEMPPHHATTFGSIALLFALILAHFKRTGERVPADRFHAVHAFHAVSDTFLAHSDHRLFAGNFDDYGLLCEDWDEKRAHHCVGFFLLGVQELQKNELNSGKKEPVRGVDRDGLYVG